MPDIRNTLKSFALWSVNILIVLDIFALLLFSLTHGEGVVTDSLQITYRHSAGEFLVWLAVLFAMRISLLGNVDDTSLDENRYYLTKRLPVYYSKLQFAILSLFIAFSLALYSWMVITGVKLADDYMIIDWVKGMSWSDCNGWLEIFRESGFIRPIPLLWWKLDVAIWGSTNLPYYLESLFIHSINTALLWSLIRRLGYSNKRSLLVASIFFITPSSAYTLGWLSSRYDLMVGMFGLAYLNMTCSLRGEKKQKWNVRVILALTFLSAALLSKENGIALPFMALALFPWVRNLQKMTFGKWLIEILPHLILTGIYIFLRLLFYRDIGGYRIQGNSVHSLLPEHLFRAISDFAQFLFYPVNLLYINDLRIINSAVITIGTVFFLILILNLLKCSFQKRPMLIVLILLPLLPIFSLLGIEGDFKDARFFYLASPFLVLAIAGQTRLYKYLLIIMILALTLLTVNIGAYIDTYKLTDSFNRETEAIFKERTMESTYLITRIPFASNGIYIYANGFPERFGLEKAFSESKSVAIDFRSLPSLAGRKRNLSTFDLKGEYRLSRVHYTHP